MDVISELMGVPVEDRDRDPAPWPTASCTARTASTTCRQPAIEASLNLIVYYQDMVAERRKKPTDDLTSALLEAEIDGDRLTDEEVIGFLFLMVVAGNETTTKLLGQRGVLGPQEPRPAGAGLSPTRSAIPLWVEETLRYDTSSQLLARTVVRRR